MKRSLVDILGYRVRAIDGDVARDEVIGVDWTAEEIINGPDIHTDLPVTLQRAKSHGGGDVFTEPGWTAEGGERIQGDPCLRSLIGVVGYSLRTTDGEVGHIEDFITETEDWRLRFMIVDTGRWWPGRKVMLSTERITRVDFVNSRVCVDMTRIEVKEAPEFDPEAPANHEESSGFLDYMGRPVK